ncbi:MAG: hypothetical protein ACU83N_06365 [Gammaproteobacteria bacterium]
MNLKPYGKLNLEQLKRVNDYVREVRQMAQLLEPTMQEADPEKLKTMLGDNFSWCGFYELPFDQHLGSVVLILGWQDEIKSAAQADDPQQVFLDFIDSLNEADDEWQGGYQGLFEKKHLIGIAMSLFKTIKSIMVY